MNTERDKTKAFPPVKNAESVSKDHAAILAQPDLGGVSDRIIGDRLGFSLSKVQWVRSKAGISSTCHPARLPQLRNELSELLQGWSR